MPVIPELGGFGWPYRLRRWSQESRGSKEVGQGKDGGWECVKMQATTEGSWDSVPMGF